MALSDAVANVLIYLTLIAFMGVGLYAGYTLTKTKEDYLSSLRTQSAWPLAVNFFVTSIGSSMLLAYPELATIAGVLGLFMYALTSTTPLILFAWLGPVMRRKCPEGFTLTQYIRVRFGRFNQIYMSLASLAFMFCFMVAELSSIGLIIETLSGVDRLLPIIFVALTTSAYTAYGGFRASMFTDKIQGWFILALVVVATIAVGEKVHVEKSRLDDSGLLKSTSLGWQLLYILGVAVAFANMFHQGFWQRAFASKDDRSLRLAVLYASIALLPTLFFVGMAGILAVGGGLCCDSYEEHAVSFFLLIAELPDWIKGITLILAVCLVCSAYDTLQSAVISTMSNDLTENKLPLIAIRLSALVFNVPVVILALENVQVFRIFLIGDLVAAAVMPPAILGLADRLYFINGIDAFVGGISGLLGVFIFGTIFYGNAYDGINLLQLPLGLYIDDYSVLGAFLVAPIASVLMTFVSYFTRMGVLYVLARSRGEKFTFPKRLEIDTKMYAGDEFQAADDTNRDQNDATKGNSTVV